MTILSRRTVGWLLLSSCLIAGCHAPLGSARHAELIARLDEVLTLLDDTGATVTARVLELDSGRELYAREIDMPYTPASNMKLVCSATGLDMFGPDHTFKTYLALVGDDLWVVGTGDPGIGDGRLARRRGETTLTVFDQWADALREKGITHVQGHLYYYDGALDAEWTHASWDGDVLHWYGAPTGGLNFNDNCVDITIHPTEPGQPVRYEIMPPVTTIQIVNNCVTGDENKPTIAKAPNADIITIGGACSETTELKSKPVENPGAFSCDAMRTHFASRGITIAGEIKRADQPPGGAVAELAVGVAQTSVHDIIDRINTNSQNFFAEAFSKLAGQEHLRQVTENQVDFERPIARERKTPPPGAWIHGEMAARAFLADHNIDHRHLVIRDGSGLSQRNRVTSRLLTDLLTVMFRHEHAEHFIDSLPKGGINGTLQQRFEGYDGHVFAKTGYISGTRALSGYVKTHRDQWLAFSIIYNHIPGSVKPYESLQDEAVKLLVHWPDLDEAPTLTGLMDRVNEMRK